MDERNDAGIVADAAIEHPAATSTTEPVPARRDEPPARYPRWLSTIAEPHNALPILLMTTVALFLVNLGGYPLYTKGEPREAVTIYDIVHGGGIILPQRAGVEIPSKPLLMHWLAALVSLIGGVTEFTVRLPSAALGIAGVLICYFYGRRLFDNVSAFIAALVMATTFQYLQAATGARVDMTLTFFTELAFFEFIFIAEGLTTRRMLLYLAIACAILTKGPVGAVLPALVAIVWIAVYRRWPLLRDLALVRGAILVAIVAGGWYVAAIYVGGPDFFKKQILAENVFRMLGGSSVHEPHAHPFYYMEMALLAGFMPWTIVMPIAIVQALRRPRPIDSRLAYVLIWFAAVLVFYNLPQSKRGVYLLALYPALALIAGVYLADSIANPDTARRWLGWIQSSCGVALTLCATIAIAALALLAWQPVRLREILYTAGIQAPGFLPALASAISAHSILSVAIPALALLLGVWMTLGRSATERVTLGIAAAMTMIALAANQVVVPAIANTLSLKAFTIDAMKEVGGDPVAYLEVLNYDVAFYSGRNMPIVRTRGKLPDYLITWRALYFGCPAWLRDQYQIVRISNPTSLDGSDQMVLLHRRKSPAKPETNLTLSCYESFSLRRALTAATSRGRISAEGPRRLISQKRVSSDS